MGIFRYQSINFRSTWKQIVRKDGRDLWKGTKRTRPSDDVSDTDEPRIKIRRNSNSSHPSLNSQTTAVDSLEQSLEAAYIIAKEIQSCKEPIYQDDERETLEKCLRQAQHISSILNGRLSGVNFQYQSEP